MPARYMAIAAPLRKEWSPISRAENPNSSLPIIVTAKRSFVMRKLFEMCWKEPFGSWTKLTVEDVEEPL
jgi:hypothetical protein